MKSITRLPITLLVFALSIINLHAASEITIDGNTYDQNSDDTAVTNVSGLSGGTWTWDKGDNLVLNNYDGGAIDATGDLIISLEGDNYIDIDSGTAISASGNLTITGDGDFGIHTSDTDTGINSGGNMTINTTGTIEVINAQYAIEANGDLTISDGNLDIDSHIGIGSNGDILIEDETINIEVDNYSPGAIGGNKTITIKDSEINSSGGNVTIVGQSGVTIDNSSITYSDTKQGIGGKPSLTITNSTIKGTSESIGFYAVGLGGSETVSIKITNSDIDIETTGSDAYPIMLLYGNENSTISIDSEILTPGVKVSTVNDDTLPITAKFIGYGDVSSADEMFINPVQKIKIRRKSAAAPAEESVKPAGRTCQDDGYPEGYEWSDAEQACILVAPAASPKRFAVVNTADK